MLRRTGRMRSIRSAVLVVVCGMLFGAVGCVNVKILTWPPPIDPCPTAEDVEELGYLMPKPKNDALLLELWELLTRFSDAASYCEAAEAGLK